MNLIIRLLWLIFVRIIIGFSGAFVRKFYYKLIGKKKSIVDLLLENNDMVKSEEVKSIIIGIISWTIMVYLIVGIICKLRSL